MAGSLASKATEYRNILTPEPLSTSHDVAFSFIGVERISTSDLNVGGWDAGTDSTPKSVLVLMILKEQQRLRQVEVLKKHLMNF